MAASPQDRLGGRFAGCRGDARRCVPSEEPKNEKVPVQICSRPAPLQAAVRSVHYGALNLNEALHIKTSSPL